MSKISTERESCTPDKDKTGVQYLTVLKVNLANALKVDVYLLFTLAAGLVRLVNNHLVNKLRKQLGCKLGYLGVLLDGLDEFVNIYLLLRNRGERFRVIGKRRFKLGLFICVFS